MESGCIEVDDIGFEKPSKLLFIQDEEVIQTCSPYTSQKTFTDSIGLRRSKHVDATCGSHACEIRFEFPVIIPNEICWYLPIRSRLPHLLCHPKIGRGTGHMHMDDLPRLELDNHESKKRMEEKIRNPQ